MRRGCSAGVPARACCNSNNPINARFSRLLGVAQADDIMEHEATIAVNSFHQIGNCTQRRDHQRHLVGDGNLQIVFQAGVSGVDDEINSIGRCVRDRRQTAINLIKPCAITSRRAGVQGRKGA